MLNTIYTCTEFQSFNRFDSLIVVGSKQSQLENRKSLCKLRFVEMEA